jgi:hypothetical protein
MSWLLGLLLDPKTGTLMKFYGTSRYIPEDIFCDLSLFGRNKDYKNWGTEFSLILVAEEIG